MAKNKNYNKQAQSKDITNDEFVDNNEINDNETTQNDEEVVVTKPVENTIKNDNVVIGKSIETKVASILSSNLDFYSRLDSYSKINDEFKSIVDVILAFDNEYKRLKTNNMYLSEKDIKFTTNLFNAIKYLLSPDEFIDLKVNMDILLDVVRNLRTTSLHPLSYASGLDKWPGRQEDAEEFLCVMHALNTIVVDGPVKAMKLVDYKKFKNGSKIKDYLTRF